LLFSCYFCARRFFDLTFVCWKHYCPLKPVSTHLE
jgi:hypothetical protein